MKTTFALEENEPEKSNFSCFSHKLDAALSPGHESEAVGKVKSR